MLTSTNVFQQASDDSSNPPTNVAKIRNTWKPKLSMNVNVIRNKRDVTYTASSVENVVMPAN